MTNILKWFTKKNINTMLLCIFVAFALVILTKFLKPYFGKMTEGLSKDQFQELLSASRLKDPVLDEEGEIRMQFYVHFEDEEMVHDKRLFTWPLDEEGEPVEKGNYTVFDEEQEPHYKLVTRGNNLLVHRAVPDEPKNNKRFNILFKVLTQADVE